jgi:hypothetical protein
MVVKSKYGQYLVIGLIDFKIQQVWFFHDFLCVVFLPMDIK